MKSSTGTQSTRTFALPALRELPNFAAMLCETSTSAPVTRQKIGRN